jgi:hypothetical protein
MVAQSNFFAYWSGFRRSASGFRIQKLPFNPEAESRKPVSVREEIQIEPLLGQQRIMP